jgi:hypothetical protein
MQEDTEEGTVEIQGSEDILTKNSSAYGREKRDG